MKLVLSLLVIYFSLDAPYFQAADERFIRFYKIDNKVKVFVNDSLIFDSKVFDGNPDLSLDIQLEKHLTKGFNKVRVELYNGYEENLYKEDRNWEIRYEIFNSKESIDYLHQLSDNGSNGLSFTNSHEIYKK